MRKAHDKRVGTRVASVAMSVVLAVGLAPLPAFANDLSVGQADLTAQAASADGYVICAGYAANEPAPEILGLNNPQYRNAGEADNIAEIFAVDANTAPDPYLVNYKNGDTPGIITGGRTAGSPMARLDAYDAESTEANAVAARQVWNMYPDIVLGTGSDNIPSNEAAFYESDARLVESANGLAANSYNPIGVTYNRTDLNAMVNTMYRLAIAADNTVKNSNGAKKTRYASALSIAKDYERYVTGTKGYALKKINDGTVKEKTVALVYSYDSSAGAFNILKGTEEQGTATQNRFLEAVQGVSINYFDTSSVTEHQETVTTNRGSQTYTLKTVSLDDLAKNVDLIILNTDASIGTDGTAVTALNNGGLLSKTFYGTNMSAGAVFGVSVNSVENAQNVGRILTCLYDEIFDQSDFIAYYYDTFYHIKSGEVANVVAEKMDGVRNWAVNSSADASANLQWEASDVSDYNRMETQAIIEEGMDYLLSLDASDLPDAILAPTSYYAMDEIASSPTATTDSVATLDDSGAEATADEAWAAEAIASVPTGSAIAVEAPSFALGDASAEAAKAWQDYIDAGAEAVLGFDVSMYVTNVDGKPIKSLTEGIKAQVKLPVDSKYNGYKVEVTQIHDGKAIAHPEAAAVVNGAITVDVTELSEFVVAVAPGGPQVMYRLYNPNSGEHFYTADADERDALANEHGWNYENEAWTAPAASSTPVYRLYNSHEKLGDHHYTTDKDEYDALGEAGWTQEGIAWYSDDDEGVGLYRLYNPNAYPSGKTGAHHYTADKDENDYLVSIGWKAEDFGWYGMKVS